jgi:hypothetical protein
MYVGKENSEEGVKKLHGFIFSREPDLNKKGENY